MFEENGALQRASTARRGGLLSSRNQNDLRRLARLAAFICGWECFSSVMSAFLYAGARSGSAHQTMLILAGIMAFIALAFVGLGILIFMRQARWAYVIVLIFLALQVLGTLIQAPVSLGVVISGVLIGLTAISTRAAFQLAIVKRETISAGAAEKVFS
jgi:hypothetical protein